MVYTATALNGGVDGIAALGTRISFHTADPGTTGASEITGTGRPATTWGTTTNGSKPGSQVTAPIPASTTVAFWGLWTAATGGTFLYGGAVPQPETFAGSGGEYRWTPTLVVQN